MKKPTELIDTPNKSIGKARSDFHDDTDFFKSGGGSLEDVIQLVEEIKDTCATISALSNEDVYMNTRLSEFTQAVVLASRSSDSSSQEIDLIRITANKREITFPHQLFINGLFVDLSNKIRATFKTISSQQKLFRLITSGGWSMMSAGDRGRLMYKLADLEEDKEELATIESIDSGAPDL